MIPEQFVVCVALGTDGNVLAHLKERGPTDSLGWNGPGGAIQDGERVAEAAARVWAREVPGLPEVGEWQTLWRYPPVCFVCALIRPLFPGPIDGQESAWLPILGMWPGGREAKHFREAAVDAAGKLLWTGYGRRGLEYLEMLRHKGPVYAASKLLDRDLRLHAYQEWVEGMQALLARPPTPPGPGVRDNPEDLCADPVCTFQQPHCDFHKEQHQEALAHGMPPSGRHG